MKVRRVLIYEGKKEWIQKTLEYSFIQKDKPRKVSNGSITLESEEVIEDE